MGRPDRARSRPLPLLALTALAGLLVMPAAFGQEIPQDTTAPGGATVVVPSPSAGGDPTDPDVIEAERALKGAELEAIRRDMEISSTRQAEIEAEIAAMEDDRATLNAKLLEVAARVQALEGSITETESRLAKLVTEETAIRVRLAGRRDVLAEVLAAAQRIGRRPPPALVVKPEDAVGAVRSAILLGAVMPELRVEAEALAADLSALVDVRARAEAERDGLRTEASRFAEDQERLSLLLDEKAATSATRTAALESERVKAGELANRARSLEELIGTMEKNLEGARKAAEAAAEAARLARPPPTDTGRLQPAMAFTEAKGQLSLPVRGVEIQQFGDDNGVGGQTQGVSVATRAGARVTSISDGWVVFAGPFRSYGQLLILNAGDGYHVVLAGMERIDVELGQFVLAGEPVGVMGNQRLASTAAPDASFSQPVLYIEFRKDGASIDPAPWWAASQDRKVRG
ncbi:murein hydrolase activator EnvC family protein [Chthonobacter albigriseus]|uniref:murein hydrolase activator EnvC family protein n=1 Tax=Chthonobacter albigriseus TaxID=1683161 RepID=UPI0015EF30F6|nr:peptidoglycan DD-metalloendopeptidase family protein [Chthonobacter albigriseus]